MRLLGGKGTSRLYNMDGAFGRRFGSGIRDALHEHMSLFALLTPEK